MVRRTGNPNGGNGWKDEKKSENLINEKEMEETYRATVSWRCLEGRWDGVKRHFSLFPVPRRQWPLRCSSSTYLSGASIHPKYYRYMFEMISWFQRQSKSWESGVVAWHYDWATDRTSVPSPIMGLLKDNRFETGRPELKCPAHFLSSLADNTWSRKATRLKISGTYHLSRMFSDWQKLSERHAWHWKFVA